MRFRFPACRFCWEPSGYLLPGFPRAERQRWIRWWRCATNDYCSGRSSDRSVSRGMIMRQWRAWFVRLGGLVRRNRSERDLVAEMDSHLQMHIEDNLRAGMNPAQARREALMKLGGVEQTKEIYRERRGLPVLENLLQDVRYGARMLRAS